MTPTSHGHSVSSIHHDFSLMIPQSSIIQWGGSKVKTFSDAASATSLCLLNLRASTDFHWERKENLNTQTASHLHLLFSLAVSLGVIRGPRTLWKSLIVAVSPGWSPLKFLFFVAGKYQLKKKKRRRRNLNICVGTFSSIRWSQYVAIDVKVL